MSESTTNSPSTPASHKLVSTDGLLSIAFHWRGDRYDHVIAAVDGSKHRSLYRSVNGSVDEDWPASPAIQQLSTETIEGKPTVLGVGCCGTTHFSVSVQSATDQRGVEAIRFDWAARLSKQLTQDSDGAEAGGDVWLGTTYQPASGRGSESASQWRFQTIDGAMFESNKNGDVTHHRIRPATWFDQRTIQWSYRMLPKTVR